MLGSLIEASFLLVRSCDVQFIESLTHDLISDFIAAVNVRSLIAGAKLPLIWNFFATFPEHMVAVVSSAGASRGFA